MAMKTNDTLQIDALKQGRVTLRMIGVTPFYLNAMSAKAKRDLLIGGGKKTTAQKREIKHNPEQEFRDSIYRMQGGPTLLGFPAPGVKAAMAEAALETKSVTKASANRLIFMPEQRIGVACLRGDYSLVADITVEDRALRVADGVWHVDSTIGLLSAITDLDHLLPAGTVYVRPYWRTYGVDHLTSVAQLEIVEVTEAVQIDGALAPRVALRP